MPLSKIEELVINSLGTKDARLKLLQSVSKMDFADAMDALDLFIWKLREINYICVDDDLEVALHMRIKRQAIEKTISQSTVLKDVIVGIEVDHEILKKTKTTPKAPEVSNLKIEITDAEKRIGNLIVFKQASS